MREEASGARTGVGRTILTAFAHVAVGFGSLSILVAGLLLAVWSWVAVGAVLDVPWLIQAGLTLIVWLVATTLLPALLAGVSMGSGAVFRSVAAAAVGGILVWSLIGVAWQVVVFGYAVGYSVWYAKSRS